MYCRLTAMQTHCIRIQLLKIYSELLTETERLLLTELLLWTIDIIKSWPNSRLQ